MKFKIILIFVLILIIPISLAELQPGKLWINDVFIPSGLEKEIELEKKAVEPKQISYVYANGQRIAKIENNEVFYFHNDHLGSPRVITDSNGNIVEEINYLPFGESINGEEKVGYNSKELDFDTKLNYYGARYYSSPTGRFITADSVKGSLIDPQSLNLYVYARNNPMKFVDPTGEQGKNINIFIGDIGSNYPTYKIPLINTEILDFNKVMATAAYKAVVNLKSAYEKENYGINIFLGYQSSNEIKEILEKKLSIESLSEEETLSTIKSITSNEEDMTAFVGHSFREDYIITMNLIKDFDAYDLINYDFSQGGYSSKRIEKTYGRKVKERYISKNKIEIYGCGIMNSDNSCIRGVYGKGLILATQMKKRGLSYDQIVQQFDVSKDYWWWKPMIVQYK